MPHLTAASGSSLARTARPRGCCHLALAPSHTRGNTGAGTRASHITGLGRLPSLGQTHDTRVLKGLCYSNCNEETGEKLSPNTSLAGLGLPAQHEVGSPVLNKGQPPLSSGLSSQPHPALCGAGRSHTAGGEGGQLQATVPTQGPVPRGTGVLSLMNRVVGGLATGKLEFVHINSKKNVNRHEIRWGLYFR